MKTAGVLAEGVSGIFHKHDWELIERRAKASYSKRESDHDRRYYDGEVIACECGRVMFRARGQGLRPVDVVRV